MASVDWGLSEESGVEEWNAGYEEMKGNKIVMILIYHL